MEWVPVAVFFSQIAPWLPCPYVSWHAADFYEIRRKKRHPDRYDAGSGAGSTPPCSQRDFYVFLLFKQNCHWLRGFSFVIYFAKKSKSMGSPFTALKDSSFGQKCTVCFGNSSSMLISYRKLAPFGNFSYIMLGNLTTIADNIIGPLSVSKSIFWAKFVPKVFYAPPRY